jgi:alcohol dehydrogenase class IV
LALSNCRSAAAHALSYEMTGRFGLEHGLAVGLLCRALLPWNADHAPERVALILEALGADSVDAVGAWIDSIFVAAGLHPRLSALGVDRTSFSAIVDQACASERLANNPGTFTPSLLLRALERVA